MKEKVNYKLSVKGRKAARGKVKVKVKSKSS